MFLEFPTCARYGPCAAVTLLGNNLVGNRQVNMEYIIEEKFCGNLLYINNN